MVPMSTGKSNHTTPATSPKPPCAGSPQSTRRCCSASPPSTCYRPSSRCRWPRKDAHQDPACSLLSFPLARSPCPRPLHPPYIAYRPVDGKRSALEGGKSRQFCSTSGEEMLRKSRALRNAGLRRRAPAHLAVPRHQLISRRSRNATGTDDRAALAAQPRPGAQEGGGGAAASSS